MTITLASFVAAAAAKIQNATSARPTSTVQERTAAVATVVDDGESILLILGEGDHTCERWELSYSLVVKLFYELFYVVMKSWVPK